MAENKRVIVIGAGAAGMLAAGRAAELGADTLLLEKMERPGKKILITGNGQCNLSNVRDLAGFMAQFGSNGTFLHAAFDRFFRSELLALLERFGLNCITKYNGKIYPATENARDVVRALDRYLSDGQVETLFGSRVTEILLREGSVCGVRTADGDFAAAAVILATGGASHPQTGSTGDGFALAAQLGHTIVPPRPALVPLVALKTPLMERLQGARLRKVRATAFSCRAEEIDPTQAPAVDSGRTGAPPLYPVIESRAGDVDVTHFGLSGPCTLEISLSVVHALEKGPVSISIDLLPGLDRHILKKEILQVREKGSAGYGRNPLKKSLKPVLLQQLFVMLGMPPDTTVSSLSPDGIDELLQLAKSLRFDVMGAYSMATALVTAGGVSLDEADPRTMESKIVNGLFFAGEVVDLDAGTGGYNLQAAFSTGYICRGERGVSGDDAKIRLTPSKSCVEARPLG